MKIVILLALVATALGRPENAKTDLKLHHKLVSGQKANIFVKFEGGTSQVLQKIATRRFLSREDRLNAIGKALEDNAGASQAKAKSYLAQFRDLKYKSLWITNSIYIENADKALVEGLERTVGVQSITEEAVILLGQPKFAGPNPIVHRHAPEISWGMEKIQAVEAYALLKNVSTNTNEIRISTIDTGVRGTHEALRDNFLGEYGWYDPYTGSESPNDSNGLGTHSTGTIAGKDIGVYPDAKWMACKGCDTATCSQVALLECGQYITCPTLTDGTEQDCSKAPHLVSNSWGGGQGNTWFNEVIAVWQTAGIIPIFSVGNSGPNCGTVSSPGDQEGVIGVGATNENDGTSTSSVGPTTDGRIKPDVTAPGSAVSAYNTADDAYATLSGTSVGSQYVSGLTAVLLAYDDQLTYPQFQKYLFAGAETDLVSTGKVCSDDGDAVFPNNVYGHGRVNVLRSLQAAIDDV